LLKADHYVAIATWFLTGGWRGSEAEGVRFMRFRSVIGAVVMAGVACCAGLRAADPDTPADDNNAPAVPTDINHRLNPQDVLRVQVFQEDDINKQCERIEVSQDYTITLPLIGVLNVQDKTIGQAQELIRSRYNKDFLVNPQVSVMVLRYADRWVNVIGSVTKQGKIEFPDVRDLSIVDAIALAGGQTRLADLKHVKLKRRNANGDDEVTEVDVDAMMKQNGGQSVLLRSGDVIFVPERML
jgi:polysaccharide export outer membrane protein